jgi:ABC-2 type transport system permease protein
MTAPVTETQVVAGKFLAAQVFYCLIWLSIVPLFVVLWKLSIGVPDPGPVLAMYVGVFALGLLTNAIGVLASAASRNQLVAAMLALTANLALYLVSNLQGLFPESLDWRRVFAYLSFTTHFDSDYRLGIVDPRYLVFYASLALFFLFVTVRVVEARKWR